MAPCALMLSTRLGHQCLVCCIGNTVCALISNSHCQTWSTSSKCFFRNSCGILTRTILWTERLPPFSWDTRKSTRGKWKVQPDPLLALPNINCCLSRICTAFCYEGGRGCSDRQQQWRRRRWGNEWYGQYQRERRPHGALTTALPSPFCHICISSQPYHHHITTPHFCICPITMFSNHL